MLILHPYYFIVTITKEEKIMSFRVAIRLPSQPMLHDEIQLPVIEMAESYKPTPHYDGYDIEEMIADISHDNRKILSAIRLKVVKRSYEHLKLFCHCEPCSRI